VKSCDIINTCLAIYIRYIRSLGPRQVANSRTG